MCNGSVGLPISTPRAFRGERSDSNYRRRLNESAHGIADGRGPIFRSRRRRTSFFSNRNDPLINWRPDSDAS
jgi:hypothetical protein